MRYKFTLPKLPLNENSLQNFTDDGQLEQIGMDENSYFLHLYMLQFLLSSLLAVFLTLLTWDAVVCLV